MEQEKYEIVKFVDNGFELEVNVSPLEDTVWLTQDQLTELYDVDQSRISRHLSSAIRDEEISEAINMRKTHIVGAKKPVILYDLDAIIAVGYRVRSRRGVVFRKWATSVLKQYMLKGYAIDSSRVLVTPENYMNLVNVVNRIDSTQSELMTRVEQLEAKYPELDDNLTQKEIDSFISQCGKLTVRHSKRFHDRFLILDNTELYNCGASLKDAGKRVFALNRMHDPQFIEGILARI